MKMFLLLPILIPFLTAIVSILAWNRRYWQRLFSVAGTAGLAVAGSGLLMSVWSGGIQAAQIGNWPAPFGITLVADLFSAVLVFLAGWTGLAVVFYSLAGIDSDRESFGYHPLVQILLMGVCGAFLTGDIFNLYVWFEVLLIASFVLMELGGEKAQLEGAVKYVSLNLIASALFLTAVAILYGMVGSLNMADVAVQLRTVTRPGMLTTVAMLFLLAFGIKAAIFPLFFWLPASYHTPPAPVSALFAGLLTKVGVYALFRVFTLWFVHDVQTTHPVILVAAGLTMVTGILGALAQREFRRILSFNLVSHIGYLIMGLGLLTPLALAGAIFYIIHEIIVKTSLFLVSGVVYHLHGTYRLERLGGLYSAHPGVAVLFLIPALSLAGIPPLPGFWGKLILIRAALEKEQFLIVSAALVTGLLTLFSMIIIWSEAFWKRAPNHPDPQSGGRGPSSPSQLRSLLILPTATLVLITFVMGLVPAPVFTLASRAAEQLANPAGYIQTVLKGTP